MQGRPALWLLYSQALSGSRWSQRHPVSKDPFPTGPPWAAPVPCPRAALPAWGSKHSTLWLFPPSAPRKLTHMSATAQLAMEKLNKATSSVFSVSFFNFQPRSSLFFRCLGGCGPGEGGGQGRAVSEDVTRSFVWRTRRWTGACLAGKDKVVSPACIFLTW